jgi:hypothetical protein
MVHERKFGRMTAFVQNKMWTDIDLSLAMEGIKHVDLDVWYDKEDYKPRLELIWSAENH